MGIEFRVPQMISFCSGERAPCSTPKSIELGLEGINHLHESKELRKNGQNFPVKIPKEILKEASAHLPSVWGQRPCLPSHQNNDDSPGIAVPTARVRRLMGIVVLGPG